MYKIRKAFPQDVDDIAKIHVECWRECYPFLPEKLHQIRSVSVRSQQWCERLSGVEPEGVTRVLLDEGHVVGFGHAMPNGDPDLPDIDYELHACYFLPQYRRLSSGPQMMLEMIDASLSLGAKSFCVWAWRDNPIRLTYSSLGLQPRIRRDRNIEGYCAPEVGYVSKDIDLTRKKLNTMIISLKRRRASSGNQQFHLGRHLRTG